MIPIRRHDRVILRQHRLHTSGDGFLPVVQVTKPANKLPLVQHIRRDLQSSHHVRLREHIDDLSLRRLHDLRRRFDQVSLERHRRLHRHAFVIRPAHHRKRSRRPRHRLSREKNTHAHTKRQSPSRARPVSIPRLSRSLEKSSHSYRRPIATTPPRARRVVARTRPRVVAAAARRAIEPSMSSARRRIASTTTTTRAVVAETPGSKRV